jgi:hypothetical protein
MLTRSAVRVLSLSIISLLFVSAAVAEPLLLNVTDARLSHDPRTGKPLLTITLAETSRQTFGVFSSTNIGLKTELRINGRKLAEPVMREPITVGSLQISDDNWSEETIRDIVRQVSEPGARVEVDSLK